MSEWPVWAREQVRLVPADPGWIQRGARLAHTVELALAGLLVAPVEHVGSTAVAGLPAKPVLDLQAGVATLDCAAEVARRLGPDGWHYIPPGLDALPWRRFLVCVEADRRVAHLHLMRTDTPRWREQLEFRDALRADPHARAAYATLKSGLAGRFADDRDAYTAGKTAFVAAVLNRPAPGFSS